MLCVALAALPSMLVAGRLADVFGGRLVPIFLVFFGATECLPGLAHSVPMLVLLLAVVGIGTGLLDIAINAHAARLEALHGIRIMDGLHAAFSGGVLVGGAGSGLLRHAGAHPSWILAAAGVATALTALGNLGPYPPLAPPQKRARPARPLLIVGFVLALAFLVENGLEAWSALFLEGTLHANPAVSGLGPGLFAAAITARIAARAAMRSSNANRREKTWVIGGDACGPHGARIHWQECIAASSACKSRARMALSPGTHACVTHKWHAGRNIFANKFPTRCISMRAAVSIIATKATSWERALNCCAISNATMPPMDEPPSKYGPVGCTV